MRDDNPGEALCSSPSPAHGGAPSATPAREASIHHYPRRLLRAQPQVVEGREAVMMAQINYHICDKQYRNCKKNQRLLALIGTIPPPCGGSLAPAAFPALWKNPSESRFSRWFHDFVMHRRVKPDRYSKKKVTFDSQNRKICAALIFKPPAPAGAIRVRTMKTSSLPTAILATACIALAGCASSSNDSARPLHNSTTLTPPESPATEASPTSGQANADPHAFVE